MHGGIGFRQVVAVILVELSGLIWDLSGSPALVVVFQPEQIQGDTAALEFLVDVGVVRHLVDGLCGNGGKQKLRKLLI